MTGDRPRLLAVVSRFKWVHINYLKALEAHFEVRLAWSGEGGRGAPLDALGEGLSGAPLGTLREDGEEAVREALRAQIESFRPDAIHVMYYNHDALTLMARELCGDVPLLYECRDPQTTLSGAEPGSDAWEREGGAIRASDAQVLVSRALRDYLEDAHELDLSSTSAIVPFGFARATIAAPSPKLSARDGRVHIALVGTADDAPGHGRWYVDIIRRLVDQGLVVHSHFFEPPRFDMGDLDLTPYHELDDALGDYHFHDAVPHRQGTTLSRLVSRYDLMGVFHDLAAAKHNESATLAVCLPTKAVCGWCLGGIPTVCFPHYRGVVEWVKELGLGFVIGDWDDLSALAADRAAIAAATERCLSSRELFTNEHNAGVIRELVAPLL